MIHVYLHLLAVHAIPIFHGVLDGGKNWWTGWTVRTARLKASTSRPAQCRCVGYFVSILVRPNFAHLVARNHFLLLSQRPFFVLGLDF